ncbi:MAG: hypothetical protein KAV82_16185 [Phycisphaerae bacterium]|nr:hypothetical protein [Phycisphaerae bacterium]
MSMEYCVSADEQARAHADWQTWRWVCAAVLVALLSPASAPAEQNDATADWNHADHQRIVRFFNFDEPDNLGSIPKYWELFTGESFPRYAGGRFDREVGRTAPPSFYLGMNGYNVAFRYRGIQTRIRPNSDYLVVGWIKPHSLQSSRATITAYYLDHDGQPLPQTQRQGRMVGGDAMGDDWHRVEVFLPSGPFDADAIGLTLWVEQASVWDPAQRPERHIEPVDIHAGAWFDDILVYRLPQVTLSTSRKGNIFTAPLPTVLETTILDHDGAGLSATLEIMDAAGVVVDRRPVPVQVRAHPNILPDLPPGYYLARLTIISEGHVLVNRHLGFAVLADIVTDTKRSSQTFGVVLQGAQRSGVDGEVMLVEAAGLGAVKVPLWTGSATTPGFCEDTATLDSLLNGLLRLRADVTGVLGGLPPHLIRLDRRYQRSLVDILNDPVESWRGFLATTVAPYASVLASWQVGADGDPQIADDPRLPHTLDAVRRELLVLMASPYLTIPAWLDVDPHGWEPTADRITLTVPRGIHSEHIGAHLDAFRKIRVLRREAYVDPLPDDYERIARLADWAARIIETRHGGADTVYAPQVWRWRRTVDGPIVEPTEDYVVYRTIAKLLGEAIPNGTLPAGKSTRALLFSRGERMVLAVWDRQAPPQGRMWEVQLGSAIRAVDLWGRSTTLEHTSKGIHRLSIGPQPVFVDGIERWVVVFQRELELLPESVSFSLGTHQHAVRIVNPSRGVLIGKLSLEVPESWEVRPRNVQFSIPVGEQAIFPVELRYSHNEPAGEKIIVADVQLSGVEAYHMRVPLRFELGIKDVDVWGYATVHGDRLIIRHAVRNRSNEALSFRAYAAAPGRDRQYKIILGLEPGKSTAREYRFENAEELLGKSIRVSLREVNGPRMHNMQVTVP